MTVYIFYGLAFLIMLALCYSYWFAFFLSKKPHILALAMFMLAVTLQTFSAVWQLYSNLFIVIPLVLPGRLWRGIFLAISSLFLLYTTWRKQIKVDATNTWNK